MIAALARSLLDRADEVADHDPDAARDLLVEVVALAQATEADDLYGTACELMGRIMVTSGAAALADAPLAAADEAYARQGDAGGAARIAALRAFAAQPQGFESDPALVAAEVAFAQRIGTTPPAELAYQRTLLDLRRATPLPDGTPTRVAQLAACLGLNRTQTTLAVLAAVAPLLAASHDFPVWHATIGSTATIKRTSAGLSERALGSGNDPRLARWLAGADLDPPPGVAVVAPEPLDLTGDLAEVWPEAIAAVEAGRPLVLAGASRTTRRVAAALAAELGCALWLLPSDREGIEAQRARRDAALCNAVLALDAQAPEPGDPARRRADAPLVLADRDELPFLDLTRAEGTEVLVITVTGVHAP